MGAIGTRTTNMIAVAVSFATDTNRQWTPSGTTLESKSGEGYNPMPHPRKKAGGPYVARAWEPGLNPMVKGPGFRKFFVTNYEAYKLAQYMNRAFAAGRRSVEAKGGRGKKCG